MRPTEASFIELLETRRSERAMVSAPLREIVNALAFALRPRFVQENDIYDRTRRLTVSAGALHAVEVLIVDWRASRRVLRYEPLSHRLEVLNIARISSFDEFVGACQAILPTGPRTALAMVGDGQRIGALYDYPSSLLSRDAGALLQTIALVSAAYRLAFCPLGMLGAQIVDALGLDHRGAQPVGCAALGRSVAELRGPGL